MMTRRFLPVGQGAFYCEQFELENERVNIIYDCGSLTNEKLVESRIRDTFKQNETIHAVFISHLDDDHINGIPYLLKYCKVEKIFFPLITETNAKYIKLYNLIKSGRTDSFAVSFVNDPNRAIEQLNLEVRPRLYQIRENGQNNNEIDAMNILSGENVAENVFENISGDQDRYKNWLYIPFNFRQNDRVVKLKENLNNAFDRNMDNEDLQEIWENGQVEEREAIKNAYNDVKGSFNTNSMTLYSGTEELILWQCNMSCRCYMCDIKAVGCLYTGDYDASGKHKWKDLSNAYIKYWNNIGCIQIPHHGSKHNYNKELAKLNAFYIISAGMRNPYRHPHSKVLKDILFNGRFPHIVTENISSEVCLKIYGI